MIADGTRNVTVAVIAKEPVPGLVKTRLCPPCTADDAAAIAGAALLDTIDAVISGGRRAVVVLDGSPGSWLPTGIEVVPQRGVGLAERLGHAVVDVGGPLVVVGMDTPQLTRALLDDASARLMAPGTDAVLGPAEDGGYWCIGLRRPDPGAFGDVPMSTSDTGVAQLRALDRLGLSVSVLPTLRDVDHFDDARSVAALVPDGRFAAAVAAVSTRLSDGAAGHR